MHMHMWCTCQPLTAKHVIAADLHTLQGLQPVVQLLLQDSTSVQAAAAFVLGTAASNNNKFQEQLMEVYPESVMHLLRVSLTNAATLLPTLFCLLERNLEPYPMYTTWYRYYIDSSGIQSAQSSISLSLNHSCQ